MRTTRARLGVVVALFMSTAVHAAESAGSLVERAARSGGRDVKIPHALVDLIEKDYRAFLKKSEGAPKETIQRRFLNISAELTQKKPIALHEDTRVVTPLGGGLVDLADFVTPLRGAFRIKLLAHKEDGSTPVGLRMFFVSKTPKRMVDGEEFGAGCDKFMEISGYYAKKASRDGFAVYTADQRYLSVVGGTFVAVAFEKEALYVASLSFADSRFPNLMCE